jgi:hypothetical protein
VILMEKSVQSDKWVYVPNGTGKSHMGLEISRTRYTFHLEDITANDLRLDPSSRYNMIYFKTASNNIFRIDGNGEITGSNGFSGSIPKKDMENESITTGKIFPVTGPLEGAVVRMVLMRNQVYDQKYTSDNRLEGKSSIIEDFMQKASENGAVKGKASYQEVVNIGPIDFKSRVKGRMMSDRERAEAIEKANNFGQLYDTLTKIGPTPDGTKLGELLERIESARRSEHNLKNVPDAWGIRKKVKELIDDEV